MPWFVELQKEYGPQGFQIVGIAMDDASTEDITKFARQMGVNYPVLLGKEAVGQSYGGVGVLPTTFFIDRDGKLSPASLACRAEACSSITSKRHSAKATRYRRKRRRSGCDQWDIFNWMNQSLACWLLVLGAAASAQDAPTMKPVVSMAPASLVTITQGKASPVPLLFESRGGYHINSNQPKSEFLIPTALKIGRHYRYRHWRNYYPDGPRHELRFRADEKLNVYTGDFEVDVSVRPLRFRAARQVHRSAEN